MMIDQPADLHLAKINELGLSIAWVEKITPRNGGLKLGRLRRDHTQGCAMKGVSNLKWKNPEFYFTKAIIIVTHSRFLGGYHHKQKEDHYERKQS